jgi:hypothetical protein
MPAQDDNILKIVIKFYGGMILQKEWDKRRRSYVLKSVTFKGWELVLCDDVEMGNEKI